LRKQLDERAKALDETEKKLKKRQSDLDQMEVQLQNALKQASTSVSATNEAIVNDLRKKCEALEKDKVQIMKEMHKTKEESNNIQSELERLLKIMSTSEEEKFALNKQIQDMQK
jgi:prefoldin subunit 5